MRANKSGKGIFVLIGILTLVSLVSFVSAQTVPSQPDTITIGSSTRHIETSSGFAIQAAAGNVSALVITDNSVTQYWQGYFGNVTGTIVLDDASNNTLFSWTLANPAGEVYAVNTSATVAWNNVTCVNFTGNASNPATRINLSTLAAQFRMNKSLSMENLSKDAFNYTFTSFFGGSFSVGQVLIDSTDNCHQAYTFVDDASQTGSFPEVILQDNQTGALIFTAILENSKNGFQSGGNDLSDFQMLVAEDGTPGQEAASLYYFYVELQ